MSNVKSFVLAIVVVLLAACMPGGGTKPTQHVAADPKAAEINMRLGLNYLQRGEYEVALEKLEKALQQDPNLPSAHNTIALLYQRLNETEKAERHFKQAVKRDPDYSEAQNNYGVFLCQQQRYKEAEQRFLKALDNPLYSNPAQAIENAGVCVSRIPDLEQAELYFRQALQINPNLSKSLIQMANLSYEKNDYLQARAYIERYQAISPWTSQALLLAIKTENQLNDQDAVASYSLLLRARFPDSDETQQVRKGQY
jgi:type IV pilus assembly protein PilF